MSWVPGPGPEAVRSGEGLDGATACAWTSRPRGGTWRAASGPHAHSGDTRGCGAEAPGPPDPPLLSSLPRVHSPEDTHPVPADRTAWSRAPPPVSVPACVGPKGSDSSPGPREQEKQPPPALLALCSMLCLRTPPGDYFVLVILWGRSPRGAGLASEPPSGAGGGCGWVPRVPGPPWPGQGPDGSGQAPAGWAADRPGRAWFRTLAGGSAFPGRSCPVHSRKFWFLASGLSPSGASGLGGEAKPPPSEATRLVPAGALACPPARKHLCPEEEGGGDD